VDLSAGKTPDRGPLPASVIQVTLSRSGKPRLPRQGSDTRQLRAAKRVNVDAGRDADTPARVGQGLELRLSRRDTRVVNVERDGDLRVPDRLDSSLSFRDGGQKVVNVAGKSSYDPLKQAEEILQPPCLNHLPASSISRIYPICELEQLPRGGIVFHRVSALTKDLNVPRNVTLVWVYAIERKALTRMRSSAIMVGG
jgi:hypothetical protein